MTRRHGLTFALVALLTTLILYAGTTGMVSGLFGPRVMLLTSGQLMQHGDAAPATSGERPAAPALQTSGVASAVARAFTTVSVEPAKRELRGYTIEARLAGKDGKALADTEIGFYDVVELLGPREMLVGVAKTDGYGTASIDYLPPQGGTHSINVRPTQWDRLAATQATATIQAARIAPSSYARERLPLDTFSVGLPSIGLVVILSIWGLFAFIVLGSVFRIPRGAHSSPYSGKTREI